MKRRTSFFSQGRSVCGHRGKNELVSQCQRTFLNPPDIVITSGGKGKNMYMLLFGYHIYRVMICWKRQWSTLWLSVGYFVCIVTFYFLHWKPDTWTVMNHLLESMWRFTRKETISRSFFVTGPQKLFTPVKLTFFSVNWTLNISQHAGKVDAFYLQQIAIFGKLLYLFLWMVGYITWTTTDICQRKGEKIIHFCSKKWRP